MSKPHWLDGGRAGLAEALARLGAPAWRGKQLWQAWRRHWAVPEPQVHTWPADLRDRFFAEARWSWMHESIMRVDPEDATRKWVLELTDGRRIQAVMIPDDDRRTLCVSSQVGCAMACSFCSTGDMGFGRNLDVGEILGQVALVDDALRAEGDRGLSNIVFMGMGEPLHNETALYPALEWLTDPEAFGWSPSRITVSTVGLPGRLERLIDETRVNIAVSLHAADPAVRNEIVPAERGFSAAELVSVLRSRRHALASRKLTAELVLLDGVNDRPADAEALVRLLRGLPVRINLIPFNPYPGGRHARPPHARVLDFQRRLQRADLPVFIRRTRGENILAACGTLNTESPGEEGS